ncbi:MAG TPA: DUF2946 family protein [Paracoccaceae bacterium]|nr:DUF2946 family protein [Paracoccaceae bacterium]
MSLATKAAGNPRGAHRLTSDPAARYRHVMKLGSRHPLLTLVARQIALIAVLVWAILPPGLMPVRGADGMPAFALCSGAGPILMVMGADGDLHPAGPEKNGHEKQPCPFAGAGLAALATPAAPVVAQDVRPLATAPVFVAIVPAQTAPFLRPSPRAPPTLS